MFHKTTITGGLLGVALSFNLIGASHASAEEPSVPFFDWPTCEEHPGPLPPLLIIPCVPEEEPELDVGPIMADPGVLIGILDETLVELGVPVFELEPEIGLPLPEAPLTEATPIEPEAPGN